MSDLVETEDQMKYQRKDWMMVMAMVVEYLDSRRVVAYLYKAHHPAYGSTQEVLDALDTQSTRPLRSIAPASIT
jgi:hypothetical protein